jgi:hypothetical protein
MLVSRILNMKYKKHNLNSSSSENTGSMPRSQGSPTVRMSATAAATPQLVSTAATIAYQVTCAVSAALSYGRGAKWTIGTASFFGICSVSPYRLCHCARTSLKLTPKRINWHTCRQDKAVGQPRVPNSRLSIGQVRRTGPLPYPVAAFYSCRSMMCNSFQADEY